MKIYLTSSLPGRNYLRKMLHRLLLFILTILSLNGSAQIADSTDAEQHQLEQCYTYSNLFGYSIDTITNEKLFETISEWLGTRYCYAGDSKSGIDCSGFVNELYKKAFDIALTGSSADLFKQVKPLKKSELHEGDLVFFKIRKKRISHVGIYLGQNKFAHASVKIGVTIDDLDEPYYKKYFYRGGRIKS
jgi:lipoprotein Spr